MNPPEKPSFVPLKRLSVSKQMSQRFEQHTIRRNIATVVYVLSYLVYLGWRATILNNHSMGLSVIYYVAEIFGFILGLTIITASRNYRHRDPLPVLQGRSVDVFVPAYKEPTELIRRTIMAAKDIEYPHQTWLLDDGKREELREMAQELGVHYLRRPDNQHAKAGNLNYALAHSAGEFVMIFDADHIAMPHALDITLGFFVDENVVMVQTPQDYYNTNALQYINAKNGGLWHDQSFFFNIGLSCRDSVNGGSCVGTGVIYRRTALEKIGGIPTETVTEDIHTSLKLHKEGYELIYLNESIAYGEAAPDLREYYKTRQRWGHGNLHALQYENVLFCKGLTFKQRWAHLSIGLIYLEGWQQLMIFMIPLATLVFGLQPFEISIFNILVVLFFPVFSYLMLQEIGCGFARFWANEIFAMTRWPMQILATAGIFGCSMPWRTSVKNIKAKVRWNLMVPQLTVMAVSLGALAYAILKLNADFETGPLFKTLVVIITQWRIPEDANIFAVMSAGYTVDLVIISGFWALYNVVRVAFFVNKVVHNAKESHAFCRFAIPLPLALENGTQGRVENISETWMDGVLFDAPQVQVGDVVSLQLFLPAGALNVRITVETVSSVKSSNATHISGNFLWETSPEKRDQLASALYSVDWYREFLNRHAYFTTPVDWIIACLSRKKPDKVEFSYKDWRPVLCRLSSNALVYGVMATHKKSSDVSLITFASLKAGERIEGIQFLEDSTADFVFIVVEEQLISSLVQKGLDGAVVRRFRVQLQTVA